LKIKNILRNFLLFSLVGPLVIGGVCLLLGVFILPLIVDLYFFHYEHVYPKAFGIVFFIWVCLMGAIFAEILDV
jgi:hypothetical protein